MRRYALNLRFDKMPSLDPVVTAGQGVSLSPAGLAIAREANAPLLDLAAPWWNPAEWTIFIDIELASLAAPQVFLDLYNPSDWSLNMGLLTAIEGIAWFEMPEPNRDRISAPLAEGRNKLAVTQRKDGRVLFSVNGCAPIDGGSARTDLATITRARIGEDRGGNGRMNGTVRSVQILPGPVSGLLLKVLTELDAANPLVEAAWDDGDTALWDDGESILWDA